FNDLRVIRGLAGVKAVFDAALVVINDEPATSPPLKDSLLVNVDDKGHSSLIQHNEAAEILYREEFNSLLYYHALTCYWYEYQPSGIFSIRPELSIQQSVYRAIKRHSGDLGFSSSYVSGVAKCLLFESVREPQTPSGLICFLNGALELESRKLLEHSPKYFFTSQLPFDWQPKAPDPKLVIDWLLESVGGHHDQVELIRAYANAIILGRYNLQRFLEVVGPGGSGKSTLIRLFTAMVGNKSVYSTQLKELETNRFETANLFGKKLVVINDAEKWHSDISTLKNITGGDKVKFEEKNKQSDVNFVYSGMVVIAANQHTGSNDYSSAIQRRRITIEFDHVIAAEKRRDLDSEFEPLLPSVVRWALDMPNSEVVSYLRSTSIRVKSLQSVRLETLTATNPIVGWLSDCVNFNENTETQIGAKERITKTTGSRDEDKTTHHEYKHWQTRLYPNYCTWCDRSGKQPISLQMFARTVTDCAKNMLGKPFVKRVRQAQGAMIKGLELCRLSVD
ncbi:MAG: phage/plasmid primase, P4 family, partial [Streptococcus sp.]|nr:phage/plasmid primase, P4 family [Streptococcus sp.]